MGHLGSQRNWKRSWTRTRKRTRTWCSSHMTVLLVLKVQSACACWWQRLDTQTLINQEECDLAVSPRWHRTNCLNRTLASSTNQGVCVYLCLPCLVLALYLRRAKRQESRNLKTQRGVEKLKQVELSSTAFTKCCTTLKI